MTRPPPLLASSHISKAEAFSTLLDPSATAGNTSSPPYNLVCEDQVCAVCLWHHALDSSLLQLRCGVWLELRCAVCHVICPSRLFTTTAKPGKVRCLLRSRFTLFHHGHPLPWARPWRRRWMDRYMKEQSGTAAGSEIIDTLGRAYARETWRDVGILGSRHGTAL